MCWSYLHTVSLGKWNHILLNVRRYSWLTRTISNEAVALTGGKWKAIMLHRTVLCDSVARNIIWMYKISQIFVRTQLLLLAADRFQWGMFYIWVRIPLRNFALNFFSFRMWQRIISNGEQCFSMCGWIDNLSQFWGQWRHVPAHCMSWP